MLSKSKSPGYRVLSGLLLTFVSSLAHASYAQFCRLDGEIVSQPKQTGCCVEFEFLVTAAEPYEDSIFGEGWDGCDEYVGKQVSVQIAPEFLGEQEYLQGQRRPIWRDALDMEVDGEMCTVVGFSAIEPTGEPVEEQ